MYFFTTGLKSTFTNLVIALFANSAASTFKQCVLEILWSSCEFEKYFKLIFSRTFILKTYFEKLETH